MNRSLVYRQTVLLIILGLLAACSFKTLYNQMDVLLPEYVEDMVSLDDVLEEKVEDSTQVLLAWHRSSQLQHYAAWLRTVQQDVGPQLTEQQALQHIARVEGFWRALSAKLNSEMARLLPLLDQQQQAELFDSITDRNEAFREEFVDVSAEERRVDYADRLSDSYENWLGELTEDQAAAVQQAAAQMVSTAGLRLQRRLAWQRGIQQILAGPGNTQDKTVQLHRFLTGFETLNNEAMREKAELNRRLIARLTVIIASSLSDEQREHFMDKTNDYIRMFTELAAER